MGNLVKAIEKVLREGKSPNGKPITPWKGSFAQRRASGEDKDDLKRIVKNHGEEVRHGSLRTNLPVVRKEKAPWWKSGQYESTDALLNEAQWVREPEIDNDGRLIHRGVVQCHCGNQVELDNSWANECDRCGSEYNGSGQHLAPRGQWGEETDEIGHFGGDPYDT